MLQRYTRVMKWFHGNNYLISFHSYHFHANELLLFCNAVKSKTKLNRNAVNEFTEKFSRYLFMVRHSRGMMV